MPFLLAPFLVFSFKFPLKNEPLNIVFGDQIFGSVFLSLKLTGQNQFAHIFVSNIQKHGSFLQGKDFLGFVYLQTRLFHFLLLSFHGGNLALGSVAELAVFFLTGVPPFKALLGDTTLIGDVDELK